jgi:hypothetical protein
MGSDGLGYGSKVQRQACKMITGALRTTATDTLGFHAHILPAHIRLNFQCLVTLPPSNPIYHVVRRWHYIPRYHRSPIHRPEQSTCAYLLAYSC